MPNTPPMDQAELINAINSYVDGDKAKAEGLAKAMRAGCEDVSRVLIGIGKSQKKADLDPEIERIKKERDEAVAELEQKDTELSELRAKTPDAAAIEESAKKKWEPKLTKAEERAQAAELRATTLAKQVAKDKIVARLITPNEQGMRVDREYAELIAAAKLDDRVVVKTDGSIDVLQIGESTPYDGESLDQKVDALVKDFRPTIPATFVVSNADSGGGVRGGTGGGGSVGLKTPQQIRQQKQHDSAFAGL